MDGQNRKTVKLRTCAPSGSSAFTAWSSSRGDDPDRAKSLYDDWFAFSISALHPIAARLVVGPDDMRDVGMGNERYDAVRPSDRGVYSQVNGGHPNSPLASRGRNKPFVRHRGREVTGSLPPPSRTSLRVGDCSRNRVADPDQPKSSSLHRL